MAHLNKVNYARNDCRDIEIEAQIHLLGAGVPPSPKNPQRSGDKGVEGIFIGMFMQEA
jgi:hypothetical protein